MSILDAIPTVPPISTLLEKSALPAIDKIFPPVIELVPIPTEFKK